MDDTKQTLPEALDKQGRDDVQSRMVSLLAGSRVSRRWTCRSPSLSRPVQSAHLRVRLKSSAFPCHPARTWSRLRRKKLGMSLLDERHGSGCTMFVRTSALVTNLGVRFKLGRDNVLAWVTTLDKSMPVANAVVRSATRSMSMSMVCWRCASRAECSSLFCTLGPLLSAASLPHG